jgi:hypothetical protein
MTTVPQFKPTKPREEIDGLDKKDVVGCIIAFKVKEYRTDAPTSYGPSPRVDGTVWVLDGDLEGTVHEETAFFGNIAKQIGEDAEPGDFRLGVVTTGQSASGRPWYGFDDRASDADVVRAATEAITGTAAKAKPKAKPVSDEAPF